MKLSLCQVQLKIEENSYNVQNILKFNFHLLNFPASAINLSAFCSEIPFIAIKLFLNEYAIDSTVWKPLSISFLISPVVIPLTDLRDKKNYCEIQFS